MNMSMNMNMKSGQLIWMCLQHDQTLPQVQGLRSQPRLSHPETNTLPLGSSTHTGLTSLGLPWCLNPYPLASPLPPPPPPSPLPPLPSPPLCSPFLNLPELDWGRWLRHQKLCLTVDQNSGLTGESLIPHRLPLHPHSRRFAIPSSSPAPLH